MAAMYWEALRADWLVLDKCRCKQVKLCRTLDRGLESKGQGTAKSQRSGMPSQTTQGKVREWGGLYQVMSKQQYGHNNPVSHKDIHKHTWVSLPVRSLYNS